MGKRSRGAALGHGARCCSGGELPCPRCVGSSLACMGLQGACRRCGSRRTRPGSGTCRCWPSPPGFPQAGDLAERRHSSPYLRKIWRDAAWERLWAAFDAGLGGVPADLRVETQAVRGETGPVLVEVADQPDDLLIIGTGRRAGFGRMMRQVGQPVLPGARALPRAGRAAVGADGRDEPPAALLARPPARAHPRHPGHVARRAGCMGSVRNLRAAAWVTQGAF